MLLTSVIHRWLVCAAVGCAALASAQAQSASTADAPKLTESFTFILDARPDRAIRQIVETMNERSEAQGLLDLNTAKESAFARAVELLRFVPFRLSDSDSKLDDFFTPNYLRAGYNRSTSEAHLFDEP